MIETRVTRTRKSRCAFDGYKGGGSNLDAEHAGMTATMASAARGARCASAAGGRGAGDAMTVVVELESAVVADLRRAPVRSRWTMRCRRSLMADLKVAVELVGTNDPYRRAAC